MSPFSKIEIRDRHRRILALIRKNSARLVLAGLPRRTLAKIQGRNAARLLGLSGGATPNV